MKQPGKPLTFDTDDYRYIQPYTRTAGPDANGNNRSIPCTFQMDPEMVQKAAEIVSWGLDPQQGVPYTNLSEVYRDGAAKWIEKVHTYFRSDDRADRMWREKLHRMLDRQQQTLNRQFFERQLEHEIEPVLRSALHWKTYNVVYEQLSWYVGEIQASLNDPIGREYAIRWIPLLLSRDIVKKAISVLQELPEYADMGTTIQLGKWLDEFKEAIE